MEAGVSHSGSAVVNPLPGVNGQTTNLNCERKLDWVLGASTDMRALVISCPAPG